MRERELGSFFSYELSPDRIAQRPVHPYDAAKLLVAGRGGTALQDSKFDRLSDFLRTGDLLVFNDSKVVPSRLFGVFPEGGQLEILLLGEVQPQLWRAIGKPLKKFRTGVVLQFGAKLRASVVERVSEYEVLLSFSLSGGAGDLKREIRTQACMPIPPYIRGGQGDREDEGDYQSIFARIEGSVAAPTASLHFTPELMEKIEAHGCQAAYVTLHVGMASFLPLQIDEASGAVRPPSAEQFFPSEKLREMILQARAAGRRVIAVGTTVVRALESMALGRLEAGQTDLFIRPPYRFLWVDGLITNFHQPGSTHLALVEAFIGRDLLSRIYDHALSHDYRFLSYGDGMFLV